jgi:hypothetical protein
MTTRPTPLAVEATGLGCWAPDSDAVPTSDGNAIWPRSSPDQHTSSRAPHMAGGSRHDSMIPSSAYMHTHTCTRIHTSWVGSCVDVDVCVARQQCPALAARHHEDALVVGCAVADSHQRGCVGGEGVGTTVDVGRGGGGKVCDLEGHTGLQAWEGGGQRRQTFTQQFTEEANKRRQKCTSSKGRH